MNSLELTSHCSYCCPSALPAFFKEGLKNREATDGGTATLRCELSKVGVPVEWKKGDKTLKSSDKYRMRQEETSAELLIRDLEVEDTGEYTCVCGDQKTSAVLTVHGKKPILLYHSCISDIPFFSGRSPHWFWRFDSAAFSWFRMSCVDRVLKDHLIPFGLLVFHPVSQSQGETGHLMAACSCDGFIP